ncbi:glycosyltransferase family 9 protein [Prosthecobacter sp. SYSU 5D2]|uniref:glycosyltransferase family 9 protein n=1 Tax=Prosthecobacter sp. SYSU 5D2 TaxID=3134134 RepID=UPI0031FEE66A
MKSDPLDLVNLRRIAIVRCCGLGDVAQMTPLLQQIRQDAPQAQVEVFLNDNVAPLLHGSVWVDKVHALPASDFASSGRDPLYKRLWRQVRRQGIFDALFCLDLSWSRSLYSRSVRAAWRIGFRTESWKPYFPFNFDVTVPLDYPRNADHTSLWFLRLWAGAADVKDHGFAADLRHLQDREGGRLARHIALVPRAGNELVPGDLKQWPLRHWPRLAEGLLAQKWIPVVLGREGDLDMKTMPAGTVDMLGKHNVTEVSRYISRCAGLIGNDSGLYHIALAMGIPAVGLFGPTAVARTGPFRAPHGLALNAPLACVPCCATTCKVPAEARDEKLRPFCLSSLAPETVCDRALEHFYRFNA